ncbi:hypothetical protein [Thalassotalea sp. ND16A]|uniref:hypothetical protein n=1 Tax=Thalassotalea sp. ND16A TaxID=1535422 RepID=UPI00051A63A0|nr:hypothetical protein [Thalassotalea sp. ND16A]KGJ98351.1 hypothetical protein ND16A_0660 [Thalassotalea sp. ND16A]
MKWNLFIISSLFITGCAAPPDGIETSNVEASGAATIIALAMTPHQKNRNHIADKKQRDKCANARLELAVATEIKEEKLITQYQRDIERLCIK